MSWRLENGFLFTQWDLYTIHLQLMKLRKAANKVAAKLVLQVTATNLITLIDRRVAGLEETQNPSSCFIQVVHDILDRQRKIRATRQRDPEVDFGFEISILPLASKYGTLGVFFTEQEKFRDLIRKQSWFRDWSYQTSTDPDENVPESEWKEREADWQRLLGGNEGILSKHGFYATIVEPDFYPVPRPDQLMSWIPTFETRVRNVVKDMLFPIFVEQQEGSKISDSNVVMLLLKYQEWLETKEGKRQFDWKTEVVGEMLCREITPERLSQ